MSLKTKLADIELKLAQAENDRKTARTRAYLSDHPEAMFSALGLDQDQWQLDLLGRLCGTDGRGPASKKVVAACGRQTGKSTTMSVYAAWMASVKGLSVALSAPSFRQSLEIAQKTKRVIQQLGLASVTRDSILDLRLSNGGRVLAVPASGTSRGFTLDSLIIDESAFLTSRHDIVESLAPALALADGQLILVSSPGGTRGLMYSAWKSDAWHKVKVASTECKRISAEFLESQKILMGEDAYRREYLADFLDSGDMLISQEQLDACISPELSEWLEFNF